MLETILLSVSGVGGALLICQFLAGLLGIGGDHADHDAGHGDGHGEDQGHHGTTNWLFGLVTFRSIAAALTFSGLGGLTAQYFGADEPFILLAAFLSGGGSLYAVASLMKLLFKLKADGTVQIENALGAKAQVYLRIPANKSGAGKITVELQNRTLEYLAITAQAEIPTGATVRVLAVVSDDTLEVEPLNEGRSS